jgi:hypothetical protein
VRTFIANSEEFAVQIKQGYGTPAEIDKLAFTGLQFTDTRHDMSGSGYCACVHDSP